jgi:cellulose synthase/poly-beta-1,6-N-acetylglucosamine synthase-like glycosyltransferase
MVEAILNKSSDYSTIELQPRGDEVSPVTLSVIIPMFDEADGVDRLFAELEQFLALAGCSYEIICVNDGSRDETLKRLIAHRRRNRADISADDGSPAVTITA